MKKTLLILIGAALLLAFAPLTAQEYITNQNFDDSTMAPGWTKSAAVSYKERAVCGGTTGLDFVTTGQDIRSPALYADTFGYIRFDYKTFQKAFGPPFAVTGQLNIKMRQDTNFQSGTGDIDLGIVQFDSTTCDSFRFRIDTFRTPWAAFTMRNYKGPLYIRFGYSQGFGGDEHIIDNIAIEGVKRTCGIANGVDTSAGTSTTMDISWLNDPFADNYIIEGEGITDCNWALDVSVTGNSYQMTGLSPGEIYEVNVRKVCATFDTADAVTMTFQAASDCGKPSNFQFDGGSSTTALVSWMNAMNAEVLYAPTGGDICTDGMKMMVSGGTGELTGLTAGTSYDAWIRQRCSTGDSVSGWSDKVTFNTNATGFEDLFENFEVIRVHPMPANQQLFVSFAPSLTTEVTVQLVDMMGRILIEATRGATDGKLQELKIDLANISAGFYQLVVSSGDQQGSTPVIVVSDK